MDRWTIDELRFAGPEHLDPGFVARYDRKQGYPEPDEDLSILKTNGVAPSATVVDLGAGTGQFALAAAKEFRHVVAVDVSPDMVRVLRERAADLDAANLECIQAGFLTFDRDAPVDAVYTRNALHHIPDFWKAVALVRIARLLRPGGVLRLRDLIYDFAPGEAATALERWFAGARDDPATSYTREDLVEHVRTEFSTFRWLMEPMLLAAGFDITSATFSAGVYGAYTCIRR